MINIAMTAALRPEVLAQTLDSIKRYMVSDADLRLVIDIAPVGDLQYSQSDMIHIVEHFFPYPLNAVRALKDSMQAAALKWTWETACQGYSDFFLQWEDDWILTQPVYLEDIENRMPRKAGVICFDRAGKSALDYPGYKGHFVPHSPGFLQRVKGKSLGGPPAIIRSDYARGAFPLITGEVCLDVLSKTQSAQDFLSSWDVFVYTGTEGKGGLVQDIGKAWRAKHNLSMRKSTSRGVTWIKNK